MVGREWIDKGKEVHWASPPHEIIDMREVNRELLQKPISTHVGMQGIVSIYRNGIKSLIELNHDGRVNRGAWVSHSPVSRTPSSECGLGGYQVCRPERQAIVWIDLGQRNGRGLMTGLLDER